MSQAAARQGAELAPPTWESDASTISTPIASTSFGAFKASLLLKTRWPGFDPRL